MKRIGIITTTRAEYGLLHPIIVKLREYETDEFRIDLIVSGTHLSSEYGMTVEEIERNGERIDYRINVSVNSNTSINISENQADVLMKFTELFEIESFNAIILLGDRYEMLAVAIAAGNTHTPVFHISGGDTTEGAIDEWIRHAITKIAYIHFTTNEISRKRVIQLGENPERVFNYGSTSIDNIFAVADLDKEKALKSVGMPECNYVLCTYHPVTMDGGDIENKIDNFISAIKNFPDIEFIITKSNADRGGARINELLEMAEKVISNLHVYTSLGIRRYLSLMKYAELVLGNSSSGIVETPAFHIPTVNIGDRQRGRLQSKSIINCGETAEEIIKAINKAFSTEHKNICKTVVSPYGDGHAAEQIALKTIEIVKSDTIDLKKKFYDL